MASRLAVLTALACLLAAGCIAKDDPGAAVENASASDANATPAALPDGREFAAAKETNKTVSNATLDGQMHMHDYWKGKENVVIYDQDVSVGIPPFLERDDNTKLFEAFINLENLPDGSDDSALVFEGTGKVAFTVTKGPQWATTYRMTFRTAGKDWSPWQNVDVGKPFEYAPEKTETDMPHSIRSLWNWKLQAVSPVPVTDAPFDAGPEPLHVQIMVTKSANVDSWPPHPDFYGGLTERVVMFNKEGKTNVQNAADVEVYGVEPDQAVPDKLISMGTATLDVFVNITQLTLPPGVPNGGFTLYWRTANTTPDDLGIFSLANETDKERSAYWHLDIDHGVVDSPYQPTSRFGFKVLANPADDSLVACYRCVPYTIAYTMTIIARPAADAGAAEMLPP